MEKLMAAVKNKTDQAEIYYYKGAVGSVHFEDGKLKDIDSSIQSGYSLRIIKNKTLGFAYTKNLNSPEDLLHGALASLNAGVKTEMNFPSDAKPTELNTYDAQIENINSQHVVEECIRILEILRSKTSAKIDIRSSYGSETLSIMNSNGLNLNNRFSFYFSLISLVFPNTAVGLNYFHKDKCLTPIPETVLHDLAELYNLALPECRLPSNKMKALFLPISQYALLWRLVSGTSGSNVYYKKSPLINKIGEKILSEKLTIYDDPLNDSHPFARSFDDEGVATQKLMIVEKGVLKNFYYDLFYADKMGTTSSGNGYKGSGWGNETAAIKPAPSLENIFIEPGTKSLKEMIKEMDSGIIVAGVLGAHTGNIPNGDFSIGVDPCLYVENGEIIGRVKNTMIAGNIYTVMKDVIEIENRLHPVFMFGKALPAVLIDNIAVVSN
ncbi:MAG: TldD/PmbA family protein [bacterium]